MGPMRVLVVEDDPGLQKFLVSCLKKQGYLVVPAATGTEALSLARSHNPDLVLLDLGLPDLDGLVLTQRLREWCTAPIIVVSARGMESDKIQALDMGADDYLTKPFGSGELLARIRVALRHRSQGEPAQDLPVFELDLWRVDQARREVTVDGQPVHLTPNEYKLLTTLIRHAGKVLTHHQLLKEVWGSVQGAQPHYLRVYMAQLRHKLEPDPARPKHLLTEPGVGYRLKVE